MNDEWLENVIPGKEDRGELLRIDSTAPLLDPVKVATIKGDRPANTQDFTRLYKVLYWLETAWTIGGDVSKTIDTAQKAAGYE